MDIIDVKVEGIEEVELFLTELPREIVASGFLAALKAGGTVIENTLVYNCPVQEEETGGILEQGELRDSIYMKVELDSQLRGGVATIAFRGQAPNAVANWIEYGHRIVGHRPKLEYKGKDVPPNPFIRRTADQAAQPAVEAFVNSIMQTVSTYYRGVGAY